MNTSSIIAAPHHRPWVPSQFHSNVLKIIPPPASVPATPSPFDQHQQQQQQQQQQPLLRLQHRGLPYSEPCCVMLSKYYDAHIRAMHRHIQGLTKRVSSLSVRIVALRSAIDATLASASTSEDMLMTHYLHDDYPYAQSSRADGINHLLDSFHGVAAYAGSIRDGVFNIDEYQSAIAAHEVEIRENHATTENLYAFARRLQRSLRTYCSLAAEMRQQHGTLEGRTRNVSRDTQTFDFSYSLAEETELLIMDALVQGPGAQGTNTTDAALQRSHRFNMWAKRLRSVFDAWAGNSRQAAHFMELPLLDGVTLENSGLI